MSRVIHDTLPCGVEYAVLPLSRRHVVSFHIRVLAGSAVEPVDKLGLARLIGETIDKGTRQRTAEQMADAFDAIGASHSIASGRETTSLVCTVLPENVEQAVALHAEFLREPTFPQDALTVNAELARQELLALEDDAQGLVDKLISPRAFGPLLGRHPLGELETLGRIDRQDLENHWRVHFHAGRMQIAAAGAVDPDRCAAILQHHFDGFGAAPPSGRDPIPAVFTPGIAHQAKDLQQQHIGACFPGVDAAHDDFPIQQVVLGILSGGMSGRLFTEVREKQGLVYWVNAWHETPRGTGMIFLGASTTPERCDRTYETLLQEVDRLGTDLQRDEIDRAVTGILAQRQTRGESTRARCTELANDLFFHGRPVPEKEKIARIEAVSLERIERFLADHPRDRLCVITLGPRALAGVSAAA